jgi:hypothetical protein
MLLPYVDTANLNIGSALKTRSQRGTHHSSITPKAMDFHETQKNMWGCLTAGRPGGIRRKGVHFVGDDSVVKIRRSGRQPGGVFMRGQGYPEHLCHSVRVVGCRGGGRRGSPRPRGSLCKQHSVDTCLLTSIVC